MLNNNVFDDCEYIQGRKITIEEEEIINNLIKYNENEDKTNNIFSIFPTQIIFKENNSITWNINNYEVVTHNKKNYYKFEDDETLYIYNTLSYITNKKEIFLYFNKLLVLLTGRIEQDIIKYLHEKFFNNINKCRFYDCLRWFICLFYYWFKSIKNTGLFFNTINYKDFRKFILKNKTDAIKQVQEILKEFNDICHLTFQYYEDLKIFLNLVIPHILTMGLSLP